MRFETIFSICGFIITIILVIIAVEDIKSIDKKVNKIKNKKEKPQFGWED